MRTGTQWKNVVSTISHMCDIVDTMFCHCGSVTLQARTQGGVVRHPLKQLVYTFIVASGKMVMGGGGANRNPK